MTLKDYFDPKKTSKLIGYTEKFELFKKLISKGNFPNVVMITGDKGIGKFTFINHFIHFYFDNINYNKKTNSFNLKSSFHEQYQNNIFPNIIYLSGDDFRNIKIEDVRKLKKDLLKKPINNNKRFVILDDVEIFNVNSLNALLKVIEEPGTNNHFILINNKTKFLIDTIKSRCLEIKFILDDIKRNQIIDFLIEHFNQNISLEKDLIRSSPGNFLKFNFLFTDKKINIDDDFLSNFNLILNLYKKEKNVIYKDLLLFFIDYYMQKNKSNELFSRKIAQNRTFLVKNINNFFLYSLSQNTLITSLENRLLNE
tara:strand:- start:3357 stop:4289 length:933 start_codon:yes stop_codon:yes gene_type:complete